MKKLSTITILLFCLLICKEDFAQNCSNLPNSLVSVTKQNVPGYRKIIFTFKKPLAAGFTVSPVTTASATYTDSDGSTIVTVPGCKFKSVTFRNVEWMCVTNNTVVPDSRIKAVKLTEQFEGHITYRIGYCVSAYHHRSVVNTSTKRQVILWFRN
jgi:hypothetical protein